MKRLTSGLAAFTFIAGSACLRATPATITLDGTLRDFATTPAQAASGGVTYNSDFENGGGNDLAIVGSLGSALGSDGTPVYAGGSGTATTYANGGYSAADQFYAWYHNDPTFNVSSTYDITLTQGSDGLYHYYNNSFFPLDGAPGSLGNVDGHNFSFTYQIDTTFTYSDSSDYFQFEGDDDVFVYINDSLVINLGGVHGQESAGVQLNTLGLTLGDSYSLDVFFAERHTVGSDFGMDTSLQLQSVPVPTGVADTGSAALLLAVALAGVFGLRSRKARCS